MIWHPSESDLALLETSDLPWWKQRLVRRHVRCCEACRQKAADYAAVPQQLLGLVGGWPQEPPWLAARVLAAVAEAEPSLAAATVSWTAAGLLALVLLVLALIAERPPLPRRFDYQASASAEAVVGETSGPQGRQRVVFYTAGGGRAEISGTGSAIGVARSDPATGAITITSVTVSE